LIKIQKFRKVRRFDCNKW